MPGLEIPIGAPLDQLTKDLKGAERQLKQSVSSMEIQLKSYQNIAKKSLDPNVIATYNAKAQALQAQISALTNVGKKGFNEFGVAVEKSSNGLTKAFSGLRTLAYIIPGLGIAGIFNLAFEAIGPMVSKLEIFNVKLSESAKLAKDLRTSQIALIKVRQDGEANAQKEISTADTLYRATQNLNLPISERIKAVNLLQEKYPAYLKNISDEDFLAGKAAASYVLLKNAIISKALAQSKEEEIAKRAIENDKLKFNNEVAQVAILRNQSAIQKAITEDKQVGSEQLIATDERIIQAQQNITKLQLQQRHNGDVINRNNQTMSLLSAEIDASIVKSGVDMLDFGKATEKGEDKLKKQREEAERLRKELSELKDSMRDLGLEAQQGLAQQLFEAGENLKKSLSKKQGSTTEQQDRLMASAQKQGSGMSANLTKPNLRFGEELSLQLKLLQDFNTQAQQIIQGSIVNTFAGLGEAIGSALSGAGNVFANLGNALLSSLGAILGQLGQMAIATGVAILGIKTALKTLNPFAAIAAGVALIALSGVVKHAAGKLGNSIGGGGNGSSYSAASPGQSVTPSTSATNGNQMITGGTVVFEISGVNLYGVLNRAGYKLARIGPI